MKIKLHDPHGFYEIGKRARQEDAMFPQLERLGQSNAAVWVVCDGIGGNDYGDIASATVAQAMGRQVSDNVDSTNPGMNGALVNAAVDAAYAALNEAARNYPSDKPMGTTMAMLAINAGGAVAAHIGDSRIYHIRPSEHAILYRSRDHSLVNDLYQVGVLTRRESEISPKRNIITRAMSPAPREVLTPDVTFITNIKAGDYFLLCTDGVCGEVSDRHLLTILCNEGMSDVMKMAALQVEASHGSDNRTAILVRVKQVENEAGDEHLLNNEDLMCDKIVRDESQPFKHASQPATSGPEAVTDDYENEGVVAPVTVPEPQEDAPSVDESHDEEENTGEEPPTDPFAQVAPQDATEQDTEQDTEHDIAAPAAMAPQQGKKNDLQRHLMILLASLVLAGGILAFFMTRKGGQQGGDKPTVDSTVDSDVTVDSLLLEGATPADSMPVGTDVAVPPATKISSVPTPSTDQYSTGSNVKVPRAPKYDSGDPPYDPYDGTQNFGSDEPFNDEPEVKEPEPVAPKPQPQVQQPAAPPARQAASQDPTKSNRGVAVPPPPRKNKPMETP